MRNNDCEEIRVYRINGQRSLNTTILPVSPTASICNIKIMMDVGSKVVCQ